MAPGSRATARALNPEDPAPNRAHCSLGTGTARGGESAAVPPTMSACCHRFSTAWGFALEGRHQFPSTKY